MPRRRRGVLPMLAATLAQPRPAPASAAAGVVVVVSGKRKSGKDFVCERLLDQLGAAAAEIGRLSAPLKEAYAEAHGLDFAELLTDGPYKEKYRLDMIRWGEERREKDSGFFARLVMAAAHRPSAPSPARRYLRPPTRSLADPRCWPSQGGHHLRRAPADRRGVLRGGRGGRAVAAAHRPDRGLRGHAGGARLDVHARSRRRALGVRARRPELGRGAGQRRPG